jgi:hypothetical protein
MGPAPDTNKQKEGDLQESERRRRAELLRQEGTRDLRHDPTHDSCTGNEHNRTRRGQEREVGEEEMVEEVITNILGETMIVMKPKKRKKKDRSKRSHYHHQMIDVNEEYELEDEQSHSHLHQPAHIPSKIAEEEGSDDGKDELQRLVDSYFETSEETPKMDPDSFVEGAELTFVEDDPSVFSAMTMPTVFADDGTVISRSTRSLRTTVRKLEEGEKNMPVIRERTSSNSGSHSGSHRSVASHKLREPPTESEDYLQSADKLSPDIDAVRDIVKDCMQINSDEQAIEVVRQALMGTESLDLALFCLTTLWVLVRKSDENKHHVLYGSKHEETLDDETPFGAIITAMATFIESGEIQTRACGVIWSLSMNSNDRKDVAQLGGCQAILEAMLVNPDDEALQVMALGALKVLSFNVVGQSSLRQISASSVVAGSMQRHISNPSIQSEGCAIILNLATGPNHFIIPVTEEEIDAVVHSILSHPESSSTQEGAIFALMSLSSSPVNIELMRQNAKLYEALDLAFSRHPDVVGRDIQVLLENLKTEPPRKSNV